MEFLKFKDYRKILQNHIRSRPNAGWGELGRLAELAQVNPTQFSQVMKGKKELTIEQAHRLAEGLGFSDLETEYFICLVEWQRAGSEKLKEFVGKRIQRIREQVFEIREMIPPTLEISEKDQSLFYSDWKYSGIRLFCSIGDGKSLSEIEEKFQLPIQRAREMMDFLVRTGLCRAHKDKFQLGSQRTFVSHGTAPFFQHQTNWRLLALEKAKASKKSIHFTSPVSMSAQDFEKFDEKLRHLIKEFSEMVRDSKAEKVACLNLDWFLVS